MPSRLHRTRKDKIIVENAYPSMDEILKDPLDFDERVQSATNYWKSQYWKIWRTLNKVQKFSALETLVIDICETIGLIIPNFETSEQYYFENGTNGTIHFGLDPSILSTLHELGHHIYGSSELDACRFSVQFYKKFFPKNYARLKAEGNKLIQTQ